MQSFLENLALLLVIFPLLLVVVKDTCDYSSLAQNFLDVVELGFVRDEPDDGVVFVLVVEAGELREGVGNQCEGEAAGLLLLERLLFLRAQNIERVLFVAFGEVAGLAARDGLDEGVPGFALLVLQRFVLLLDDFGDLLFLGRVVVAVVLLDHAPVVGLEFLQFYVGHDYEQVDEHLRRFGDEQAVFEAAFVNVVSEVLGHEVAALLLCDCTILVADLVDLLLLALDLVVARAHFLTS